MKKKPTAKAKAKRARPVEEPVELRIVRAAMDIAAEKGWREVSSAEVAKRSGLPVDEVRALCPDRIDVLRLLNEEINIAMLEGGAVDGSVRDNLFELMMRRFEALEPYRAGLLAVADAARREPSIPLRLAGDFHETLGHVLEEAGLKPTPLHSFGLGAVALATFKVWCEDETGDLSATMAALDKRLGQAEQLAEFCQPLFRRAA